VLKWTSLEFLRASGFCTFVFWHCAKFQTFVLKIQKTKEQRFFYFFVLKNTKLLVLKHKHLCKHQQKRKDNKSAAAAAVILLIMKTIIICQLISNFTIILIID